MLYEFLLSVVFSVLFLFRMYAVFHLRIIILIKPKR